MVRVESGDVILWKTDDGMFPIHGLSSTQKGRALQSSPSLPSAMSCHIPSDILAPHFIFSSIFLFVFPVISVFDIQYMYSRTPCVVVFLDSIQSSVTATA